VVLAPCRAVIFVTTGLTMTASVLSAFAEPSAHYPTIKIYVGEPLPESLYVSGAPNTE
jgi:hypothetical protein